MDCLTIDVEEWFHVLDTPDAPSIDSWAGAECRVVSNIERLLEAMESHRVRSTFFWLGWVALRHKDLVRKCLNAGHEIASHGYGHLLAYKVGPSVFARDVMEAKRILEDITGGAIRGFRSPGFGITEGAEWAFDVIRQAGHDYDASVFPASRGHGGMCKAPLSPYIIQTKSGPIVECPMSVVDILGQRVCLFSGGYLRIAPIPVIRWGIDNLRRARRPLIVLIHPREIDPDHPRLPLGLRRRFKCYVNLKSTMRKLRWLCRWCDFRTMAELIDDREGSSEACGGSSL